MPDVPDQLREWSKTLADAVEPADIERAKSPMTTSGGAADNRRWLAVAASVLVVAAGIIAVASIRSDDDPDRITPATNPPPPDTDTDSTTATTQPTTPPTSDPDVAAVPPSTAPATTSGPTTTTTTTTPSDPEDRLASWPTGPAVPVPVDDVPRLLPTASIAPAGTPMRAEVGGSADPATFTQVFADADRDILLTLQTRPNATESTPADIRQSVTIDGWDDAFVTGGSLRVVASDPSGFVRLTGTGMDSDEAVAIIASMQRRADGIPGWDLAPITGHLEEINGAWNDSAGQRFVTWFDGDRVVAQMLTSPAHTDLINQALTPSFDRVDVNGMDGWLSTSDGRRSIVWSPDGATIVVLGVVDDRIDPLTIAASVTELSVADYESVTTTEVPPGVGDGCDAGLFC